MKKNNKGFTLAELLIVVAVIAVLVAVAIPTFSNQLEKSRQAVDISNLRGAYAAAQLATFDAYGKDSKVYIKVAKKVVDGKVDTSEGFDEVEVTAGMATPVDLYYDPESGLLVYNTSLTTDDTGIKAGYMSGTPGQKIVGDWTGIKALTSTTAPEIIINYTFDDSQTDDADQVVPTVNRASDANLNETGVIKVNIVQNDTDGSKFNVNIGFEPKP